MAKNLVEEIKNRYTKNCLADVKRKKREEIRTRTKHK